MSGYEVKKLKIQQEQIKNQIKLLELELGEISEQIFKLQWTLTTWEELEERLKQSGSSDYNKNPVVRNGIHHSYCRIENGELVIGPYYNNDHFPRGKSMYVRNSGDWHGYKYGYEE